MDSKHSPGSWIARVYDTHYVITAPDGPTHEVLLTQVARDPVVLPETWETHQANARLMAAAPDLLEACELLYQLHAAGVVSVPDRHYRAIKMATTAIAKAKGNPVTIT